MVCLTPRFLVLAALVATVAMPTFVLQTDARAVDLVGRHHGHHKSESSSSKHFEASDFAKKGKGKVSAKPVISLPASAKEAKATTEKGKNGKKHRKGGHEDDKRDIVLSNDVEIGDGRNSSYSDTHHILAREADPEHHHHHHHHNHGRQEDNVQVTFSLQKRARSRIYGKRESQNAEIEEEVLEAALVKAAAAKTPAAAKGDTWDPLDPILKVGDFEIGDGRHGSYADTHSILGILKRSPEPHHHHHHDHHDHEKVVVNGEDDDVHVHERRMYIRGRPRAGIHRKSGSDNFDFKVKRSPHHHHHHDHHDHDKVVVNGDNDKVHVHERREPHHHHHHDQHEHDKVVVNGDNDKVHVHERREPHHHHHDHHDHDKTVINGSNDDVHVYDRDTVLGCGKYCGAEDGHFVNFPDGASSDQQKRSEPVTNQPGVPGTVDIMVVDGPVRQRLASLVLSSVSDNVSNSTTNGSTPLNGTKFVEDVDAETSPFVLDASNTTKTQFYLVANDAPSASSSNTLEVLKAATSSKADGLEAADIKVTLQVPVFEPAQAAMRSYCATFDPNPPMPAPLMVEECFSSDDVNSGKMTEASLHKSQTFAYNPDTGVIRPMWFGVTDASDLTAPLNSTVPSANLTVPVSAPIPTPTPGSNANSTSGANEKQMNFKIPTSNKNTPIPVSANTSIALPAPLANVTQTVNGTAGSLPVTTPSPQNVMLIFTPAAPAVRQVSSASEVASFEPSGFRSTDPVSGDDGADMNSASMSSSSDSSNATSTTFTDSSNTASVTDTSASSSSSSSASDATDVMSATSSSDSMMPTSTSTQDVDEAAIEKMYQQPHAFSN